MNEKLSAPQIKTRSGESGYQIVISGQYEVSAPAIAKKPEVESNMMCVTVTKK